MSRSYDEPDRMFGPSRDVYVLPPVTEPASGNYIVYALRLVDGKPVLDMHNVAGGPVCVTSKPVDEPERFGDPVADWYGWCDAFAEVTA